MATYNDSFTGTNFTQLEDYDARWVPAYGCANGLEIDSNTAVGSSTASNSGYYCFNDTINANQYSQCKMVNTAFTHSGVVVRANTANSASSDLTCYYFAVSIGYAEVKLGCYQGGVAYSFQFKAKTINANDVIKLSVTGSDPVVLTATINGNPVTEFDSGDGTFTDSTYKIASGKPGLYTVTYTNYNQIWDDWEGGDLSAGTSSIPIFISHYQRLRS